MGIRIIITQNGLYANVHISNNRIKLCCWDHKKLVLCQTAQPIKLTAKIKKILLFASVSCLLLVATHSIQEWISIEHIFFAGGNLVRLFYVIDV